MERREPELELGSARDEHYATDWMIGASVPMPSRGDDVYVIGESATPWDAGITAGAGASLSVSTEDERHSSATTSGRAGLGRIAAGIAPGMRVVGADGGEIGIVTRVAGEGVVVGHPVQDDLLVAWDAVDAVDGATVRLRVSSAASGGVDALLGERGRAE